MVVRIPLALAVTSLLGLSLVHVQAQGTVRFNLTLERLFWFKGICSDAGDFTFRPELL